MYQLYSFAYSQHARRVISLLEELALPYQILPVDMMADGHQSPEYFAINPNGQVPTLLDGLVKLHESNAILRYLCLKEGADDWYPKDITHRVEIEQWLDWNQCRLGRATVDFVLNKAFMGEAGDREALARGEAALPEMLAVLEAHLEGRDFLVTNRPSIADLSVASNIFHLGFADMSLSGPNSLAWFERISCLKGFQKSLPQAA